MYACISGAFAGSARAASPSRIASIIGSIRCHDGDVHLTPGRDRSPKTCSSASCATSASTRSPRATGRSRRARPGSSTWRGCSSTSCTRSASTTPRSTSNGYVTATLPGDGPVDRPDRARGHEPGRARRRRRADRPPRPRRRRRSSCRAAAPWSRRRPATTVVDVERRHAARRRRQGRRGRDHDRGRSPGRAPRPAAAHDPGLLHARRGDRRGRDAVRRRALRRRLRVHARRLRPRRAAGRDVLRRGGRSSPIHGVDAHPGWAKDTLVNATRIAAEIVAALPAELTPERTDGRDGFIHVYELEGGSGQTVIRRSRATSTTRSSQAHSALVRTHRRGDRRRAIRARASRSRSRRSTRTCAPT